MPPMIINKSSPLVGWMGVPLLLIFLTNCLSAATFGLFDYTDNGSNITIRNYPSWEIGAVTIPSTINSKPVTIIGSSAFGNCSGLTSVTIPTSVKTIEDSAFFNCYSMKVTIPSSVTTIGSSAFFGCTNLTSISIPSSVTSMGSNLFAFCYNLTTITVNASSAFFSSSNGVLFNKSQTTLIQCPAGKSGNYEIPSTVTNISNSAFQRCSGLTSVTIPSSVTTISSGAFQNCGKLTSLHIPAGVTSIGNSAFADCGSLAAITVDPLNPAYSSVEGVLFNKSQTILIQFPGGKAGSYAIPSGITTIGDSTFSSCRRLSDVTIPFGVTSIGTRAFSGCDGLMSISIPSSVTSIGSYAFSNCSILTNVSISSGITSIGNNTFERCSSLTNFTIPSTVTSIGSSAFSNCISLVSLTIPFSVTSIGDSTFYNCDRLTNVSIPSSVTTVGNSAFSYCDKLMSVSIPSSATSIGSNPFGGSPSLTAITVDSLNPAYTSADGVLFNKSQSILIQCPGGKSGTYEIPSGVITLGYGAFSSCRGLTSITIPSGVTSIGINAFSDCGGMTSITIPPSVTMIEAYAFNSCIGLTSIGIPPSVTSIGSSAFRSCSSLTSITIPLSVTTIEDSAFFGCTSLTSIMADSLNPAYISVDGVLFNKGRTILICYPSGKSGSYSIPSGITSISTVAMSYCGNLTSVTVPSSVIDIGSGPFSGCGKLTDITVDSLNPAYRSSDGVLFNKSQTVLIQYPGGKAGSYTIPSGVATISTRAFSGCDSLTSIAISSSVKSIGSYAFSSCRNLTSAFIPSGVTSIGDGPFSGCSNLTAITVDPANLSYSSLDGILHNKSQNILIQCPAGKSGNVVIPATVASLKQGAFSGCENLTSVSFNGNAPLEIIYSFPRNLTIYHFNGAVDFAPPRFAGYAVTNMGSSSPVKPWLIGYGYSYDTDWLSDPNGDGVNLLMAYALKLHPRENLCGSMPIPVISGNQLRISFYAKSEGIIYTVETSPDLQSWSQAGVILSAFDASGYRTASVASGDSGRFLRLVVYH